MIPYEQLSERTEVNARAGLLADSEVWKCISGAASDEIDPHDCVGAVARLPGMPRSSGIEVAWNFR